MRSWFPFALLLSVWGIGCAEPVGPEVCDDGLGASALTAPGRHVLGEAAPYPEDIGLAGQVDKLQVSQRARRALGWDVLGRVLGDVSIESPAGPVAVPRFQTWYDREDLRRVVSHLSEARGGDLDTTFTEAELDEAFAWNTDSVHEQEAWPADRLAEYLRAIDSEERARGAGGIERVGYDPRAARHLLLSHRDVARCLDGDLPDPHDAGPASLGAPRTETVQISACGTWRIGTYRVAPGGMLRAAVEGDALLSLAGAPSGQCDAGVCLVEGPAQVDVLAHPVTATPSSVVVDWDEREAPFVPCMDGGFPVGSAIIKADYRRVGFGVLLAEHPTDAETLQKHQGAADWADGSGLRDPGPEQIFTLELPNGNRFRLAALHVMTKELDHWVWATLWWSPDPELDFGADRPAELATTIWSNYKMCAATEFEERDPDPTGGVPEPSLAAALGAVHRGVGGPTWCSNPYLERGPGNAATNCVGCHQYAGTELSSEDILLLPYRGRVLERRNFPTDYAFTAPELDDLFR